MGILDFNSYFASLDLCRLLISSAYVLKLPILRTIWTKNSLLNVHNVCFHETIESDMHLI